MANDTDDGAPWGLPDSPVCSAALQLTVDVSPAFITNHCVRSYLFGREIAAAKGLRGNVDYDDETLFLACVLHDLGVTAYGSGDQRFEVDGADAAKRFLRSQGISDDQATVVWQSIALHTSIGLAERFGTVQSVAFLGISVDVDGVQKGLLPAGFADRVHAAWPRHDLGYRFAEAIARDVQCNPVKGPPFSFPSHVHEVLGGTAISFVDVVENSGWGDRPRALPHDRGA